MKKLIFSELRVVGVTPVTDVLTDSNIVKAVTVNTELNELGYTLSPSDVLMLAKSKELDTFYKDFKSFIGEVKAKPMYPDFPTTIMNMDEATFRFHQLVHYMSTYGVRIFTGESVSKGWLPETSDTEKTVDDVKLLNSKVIELVDLTQGCSIEDYAYKKILSRKERMTDKDITIIEGCLKVCNINNICDITIPFKENLIPVFNTIFFSNISTTDKKTLLHNICQHTGDVFKCLNSIIGKCHWHFRTSQKKLLVKLLESYSVEDFKNNIILSNKKAERVNLLIQYLDYNNYSRSIEHKDIVRQFRNSELKSWESTAKQLVSTHSDYALSFICSRPGTAVRWLTYLLRNGYTTTEILNNLIQNASNLNTGTLVTVYNKFKVMYEHTDKQELDKLIEIKHVTDIVYNLIIAKLQSIETPFKNKSVYIKEGMFDLAHSVLLTNEKSTEGGYIRSGIAYKIPEGTDKIRFFVYWNDSKCVDVDLHAVAKCTNGTIVESGYDAEFYSEGIAFSGDITHSDASEYTDIQITDSNIETVLTSINVYSIDWGLGGRFKDIEECFVGCEAVCSSDTNVKLDNASNCFYTHYLTGNYKTISYGFINVPDKYLFFIGDTINAYDTYDIESSKWSDINYMYHINDYLSTLIITQNATIVDTEEEADYVLIMDKPLSDKEISLIDNNFFFDN